MTSYCNWGFPNIASCRNWKYRHACRIWKLRLNTCVFIESQVTPPMYNWLWVYLGPRQCLEKITLLLLLAFQLYIVPLKSWENPGNEVSLVYETKVLHRADLLLWWITWVHTSNGLTENCNSYQLQPDCIWTKLHCRQETLQLLSKLIHFLGDIINFCDFSFNKQ